MKKLAFLVSDEGWLFEEVFKACNKGLLNAEIALIITNNSNAGCILRAEKLNVKLVYISTKNKTILDYSKEILNNLKLANIDLVVTMFNRLLSTEFLEYFKDKCINLHLSLLPAFPGVNPRKQALEYGIKFTGATIHFIDEGIDTGKIISQTTFPINSETTEENLYKIYGKILPKFILNSLDYIVNDNYEIVERKVILKGAFYDQSNFSPSIQSKFLGL